MAITTTPQYAALSDVRNQPIQARPGDTGGKRRALWFAHTCQEEPTGSRIKLTVVPSGARVVAFSFQAASLANGSTTLAIGDADDIDRLVEPFEVNVGVLPYVVGLRAPSFETPDVGFGYRYPNRTELVAFSEGDSLNTSPFWGYFAYIID